MKARTCCSWRSVRALNLFIVLPDWATAMRRPRSFLIGHHRRYFQQIQPPQRLFIFRQTGAAAELNTQAWLDNGDADATPDTITTPFIITPPISRVDAKSRRYFQQIQPPQRLFIFRQTGAAAELNTQRLAALRAAAGDPFAL
jgi:hypothetical protein